MTARESSAVEAAVNLVLAGTSVSAAAAHHGVAISSVRRALRRRGVAPLTVPSGEAHHAYIDGRTAKRGGK